MNNEQREYQTPDQSLFSRWLRQQGREEDWRDFAAEDYTLAAEDVIAELERQEGP